MNLVYTLLGSDKPGRMSYIRKLSEYLIKLAILAFLIYAIYKQIISRSDFAENISILTFNWNLATILLSAIAIALVVVNWGLEARKWQVIVRKIEPHSYKRSWMAILSGVTVGMFTPNRIGEFGGKLLFVDKQLRSKAIVLTFFSSITQWICIVVFGLIGAAIFNAYFLAEPVYNPIIFNAVAFLTCIVLIALAYRIPAFLNRLSKISIFKKFAVYIPAISEFKSLTISNIFAITSLRHITYSIQYVLLLIIFGIHIAFPELMVIVAVIFLAQTIIPSIAIIDVGIRGGIAALILQPFTDQILGILTAALMLWIINLVIPAFIGYYYISKKRFLQ